MSIARVALSNPRTFLLGVGLGAILISAGFFLALVATQRAGAMPGDPGVVWACVNPFNGQSQIRLPGQPANCPPGQVAVPLGSTNAAVNLETELRQELFDLADAVSATAYVSCEAGERAISGGVQLLSEEGHVVLSNDFTIHSSFRQLGSERGWQVTYSWPASLADRFAGVWVMCVS